MITVDKTLPTPRLGGEIKKSAYEELNEPEKVRKNLMTLFDYEIRLAI